MSRIRILAKDPAHSLVIGLDHAIGFFVQIYSTDRADFPPGKDGDFAFDDKQPFIDMDMGPRFNESGKPLRNYNRSNILELVTRYASDRDPRTKAAIMNMAMDLDPALIDNPHASQE